MKKKSVVDTQNSARRKNNSRRQKRIIMVPRKTIPLSERQYAIDTAFQSLNTPPALRKPFQIDSIISLLMQWPEISIIAKGEHEMRLISRNCELEYYDANSFLFSNDEIFDGMFIIYSGKIVLFHEKNISFEKLNQTPQTNKSNIFSRMDIGTININRYPSVSAPNSPEIPLIIHPTQQIIRLDAPYKMNDEMKELFSKKFGDYSKFEAFDIKYPHSIIGFDEISSGKIWKYSAVTSEPTYVIRIDSTLYKKTIAYLREEKKQNLRYFVSQISELETLSSMPELFERLVDVMEEIFVPKGTKNASFCDGWIIIFTGSVGRYRKVDFSKSTYDPRVLTGGAIDIKLPTGETLIRTDVYGPGRCIIDESISESFNKPFRYTFLEDSVIYTISMYNLKIILPIHMRREIEQMIIDDPNDDYLIRKWVDHEMLIQWKVFKRKVRKESKNYHEYERIRRICNIECHKVQPPKAIKDHQKKNQNPRFRARREIETLQKTQRYEIESLSLFNNNY